MEKTKMRKAYSSLYKNELRLQVKPIYWWFGVLAVLIFISLMIYPVVDSIMGSLTAEERAELESMGAVFDYSSVTAYFLTECVQTHIVGGMLFACCFASLALARDFKRGTYELLYTNALSRRQVLLTKFSALVSAILMLNVFLLFVELVGMCIIDFKGIDIVAILAFALFGIIVQLIVASIVFGIIICKPQKLGLGVAIGLPLVLYFVSAIAASVASSAKWVENLSPLTIFNGMKVGAPFDINYLVLGIFALLAVIVIVLGFRRNQKIDY